MRANFVVLLISTNALACSDCHRNDVTTNRSSIEIARNDTDRLDKHTTASPAEKTLHGVWDQQLFVARTAIASIHASWLVVTITNRDPNQHPKSQSAGLETSQQQSGERRDSERQAFCNESEHAKIDLGIQLSIPSGPQNDFFAGRDAPVEIRLLGDSKLGSIPASYAFANINPFDPEHDESIRGFLHFRINNSYSSNEPTQFISEGSFTAILCNNQPTRASIPDLPTSNSPVSGNVAGHPIRLESFQAFTRDNGFGGSIIILKGFENEHACHTDDIPTLFGIELGPDRNNSHVLGTPLPSEFRMMVQPHPHIESDRPATANSKRNNRSKEETSKPRSLPSVRLDQAVQAPFGGGWVQLDSVDLREDGTVTGLLAVDNSDDEPAWHYSLSGEFTAKVCGVEKPK